MSTVFVSYSHKDRDLVERLIADLLLSEVDATYDRWLLSIGDSILEKISHCVLASDYVIAILSSSSIDSTWVKKELAIAMSQEVEGPGRTKVLPVLVDNCVVPPFLRDKMYADFRSSYVRGLRSLLEVLNPAQYAGSPRLMKWTPIDTIAEQEFVTALDQNDHRRMRAWFTNHRRVLSRIFGALPWTVSEAVLAHGFAIGKNSVDFIVYNGSSSRNQIILVDLDLANASNAGVDLPVYLNKKAAHLVALIEECRSNLPSIVQLGITKVSDSRVAWHFENAQSINRTMSDMYGPDIAARIFCGRRYQGQGDTYDRTRREIAANTNGAVEIISYDRILDLLPRLM